MEVRAISILWRRVKGRLMKGFLSPRLSLVELEERHKKGYVLNEGTNGKRTMYASSNT